MKDEKPPKATPGLSPEAALAKIMKGASWRILFVILCLIGALYEIQLILGSSLNIQYVHWTSLSLLSLGVMLLALLGIGYRKYLFTYSHSYYIVPNIFMSGYLLFAYLSITALPFIILREYYYLLAIIVIVIISPIYLWRIAVSLTKNNFKCLYCLVNNKILFNHYNYGEYISKDVPKVYFNLVLLIFGLAVANGLVGHSFHSTSRYTIALGLALFGISLISCQVFIYALYFFVVVHPRVVKAFNQPVLSNPMETFKTTLLKSSDARLDNDIFGENPIKRVIQYEEVFHK